MSGLSNLNLASNSSSGPENNCSICHESLLITAVPSPNENSSDSEQQLSSFIDDILLRCGHHFHWSCIIEYGVSSLDARGKCALCGANVLNEQGRLIVDVRNEGGLTQGFDLGSEIEEELFLSNNPEIQRKSRFFSLINQGDFVEAEVLLKGEDEGANGEKIDPNARYEEGGNMTALHMAAVNDDVDSVRVLLRYGADKNLRTDNGETAFGLAVAVGASRVTAILSQ